MRKTDITIAHVFEAPEEGDTATSLLKALRDAGCHVFIEDGQFYCAPPLRRVEWVDDPEAAIDEWRDELLALLLAEHVMVH